MASDFPLFSDQAYSTCSLQLPSTSLRNRSVRRATLWCSHECMVRTTSSMTGKASTASMSASVLV